MKVRTCVHCGREYVSDHPHSNVCSEKCRRERLLQKNREYRRTYMTKHSNIGDPVREYAPVSLEALRHAKTQPRGCSDTRWKMELSRRRMARECPEYYNQLPDPDRLP